MILRAWLLVVELTSRRQILKMVIWIKYQERSLAEITKKDLPQSFKTNGKLTVKVVKKVLIYNPMQNIWNKLEKFRKTGQDKKSLISTFPCFLNATAKV